MTAHTDMTRTDGTGASATLADPAARHPRDR